MVAVTGFDDVRDVRTAKRSTVEWTALVERLSRHDRRQSKDGPGWCPAVFREPCTCGKDKCPGAGGHRIDDNVIELHALVFDLDKKSDKTPLDEATAHACLKRLEDRRLSMVVHTTHSHNPAENRWSLRVVIGLSRPVPAAQWQRFWRAAVEQIQIHVEPSCFNPARFWYAPSAPPHSEPWSRSYSGDLLDVDAVLDVAPAPAAQPERARKQHTQTGERFDIYRFMAENYGGARPDFSDGLTRWEIECPWEHEHSSKSPRDTMISFSADAGPGFSCLHDHCKERHWKDFREHHEPGYQQRAAERANDIERARARKAARSTANVEIPSTHANEQLNLRHAGIGPGGGYRCTDAGNARRFADMHSSTMRFVKAWNQWVTWDGRRWQRDTSGAADRAGKEVRAAIYADASRMMASAAAAINAGGTVGPTTADVLVKWAEKSSSHARLDAMLNEARSEVEIAAKATDFDRDPWLLNVANGTIDLRDGEIRKHRQADMITLLSDVEYDPCAQAPEFEIFLAHVLPDQEVREWAQRYLGYALTGLVTEQKFAFWVGKGGNGKNVCADVVISTLGEYAMVGAPDLLLEKHGEAHPTELADIEGKRLVVCSEIEPGRSWAEARIKQITGDKTIKARRMKQDFYEFAASGKLVVLANTKPKVRSRDNGLWRRMCLQPWPVNIPQAEQDKQLLTRLIANERPGVLAWLVRGCLAWQRMGLAEPRAITLATSEYRKQEDVIGMWIADCCKADPSAWQETSRLYESYKTWCKEAGNDKPWSLKAWIGELVDRPGIARRSNGYARGLEGIRLLGLGELPDEV